MTALGFKQELASPEWVILRADVKNIRGARQWASSNGAFRLIVEHLDGYISGHVKVRGIWRERSLSSVMPDQFLCDDQRCIVGLEKAVRRLFSTSREK